MRPVSRLAAYFWASPYTMLGLSIGILGIATGGRGQCSRGIVEFHGGFVTWLLRRIPIRPIAMTLGHTIIGTSAENLDMARQHERVHVRQYECWGPFFAVAYLGCSMVLWAMGRNAYRDNPFEIHAFRHSSINREN